MPNPILVPLDGSPFAERALPYATVLCRATGAQLALVRAAFASVPTTNAAAARMAAARLKVVTQEAEEYLSLLAQRIEAEGRAPLAQVRVGAPATVVLEEAARLGVDLITMTTHGRAGPGRVLFGSVANELVHRATVPILLIPPQAKSPWMVDHSPRVLVPLDGSGHAEIALRPAADLANAFHAEILLVRTADHGAESEAQGYLDQIANSLRSEARMVRYLVLQGQPAPAILRAANEEHAAVIAMATHGRTGIAQLVMGSVAEAIVHSATTPILIVRPTNMEAHAGV
jgi:nucleotide-binding universal stress UspA family protein